ncbi:MAG: ATP-binding cassette domain-containing protein [Meiothermus sp.]|uniref:phosphonate ABC transporter ATP-binding protein n=1 Tax=Meiothermus sp. TaxID=1955249 RepID=UPI0025DEBF73|nr:ATP-binding cassette domain-containing protein [Meiothermus sp.]MCS7193362.1 ATP-binding cassette domain-containing protein [Meiothermus sp.]MDW8091771.1 ATP-binding cassette domain-containing protein [Meiothermus sp.]
MELVAENLGVRFGEQWALRGVSLRLFERAEPQVVALVGPSGAGKSTFIRVVKGLLAPTEGRLRLGPWVLPGAPLGAVRRASGMIFQQFQLVERLTALENVLLGRLPHLSAADALLRRFSRGDLELARYLLERVGMLEHAWKRADQLSGGQRQRVGIARALAQEPALILADEPISALDPKNAAAVMELLLELVQERRVPLLITLHHLELVRAYAHRVVAFRGGEVFFAGSSSAFDRGLEQALYFGEGSEAGEEARLSA